MEGEGSTRDELDGFGEFDSFSWMVYGSKPDEGGFNEICGNLCLEIR